MLCFTEDVQELCSELQPLLAAELKAGNSIVETWRCWPHRDGILVMLGGPFRCSHPARAGVEFRRVDDPHYWLVEYLCERTHHRLACRFGD